MRLLIILLPSILSLTACGSTINTLPPVTDAATPIQEIALEIPDGLDIQSVSYSATMYPNVTGTSGTYGVTSTTAGGRAFVQVVAVDRKNGEQVLLLYENIAQRAEPIQIIRFRTGAATAASPE